MDFIKFVEDIVGVKLLSYQKKYLRIIEKTPYKPQMLFARGQTTSRCFYGWIYKMMYDEYCKKGEYNLLDYDNESESFKREYECIWENIDEKRT